jgi:excinuclease UvrABC nuclease subunit
VREIFEAARGPVRRSRLLAAVASIVLILVNNETEALILENT